MTIEDKVTATAAVQIAHKKACNAQAVISPYDFDFPASIQTNLIHHFKEHFMNKRIITTAALALCLSACGSNGNGVSLGLGLGGLIGNHVGIGTSINIPLGGNKQPENNGSGINVIEQKIITHFDAQGNATEHAVKGGYYRQLISQDKNGYLVQDFYATGEKRTDPMTLSREQVFTFRTHPNNGSHTVYAINGNIMQQQNFRNGKTVTVGQ